jgi:hypothetical protein
MLEVILVSYRYQSVQEILLKDEGKKWKFIKYQAIL